MPCECRRRTSAAAVLAAALVSAAAPAHGQSRQAGAAIQAVRQAILDAEDRRAPRDADLRVLLDGAQHPSETVQRMAVRALGRLERPALAASIEPALASPFPSVRAAAAEALGQAAATGDGNAAAAAQAALLKQLGVERDQAVIGAACWTLGRLPYTTAQAARSAEVTLLVAALPLDAPAGASMPLQLGVARGLESLLRRSAKLFTPSQETARRLKQMAVDRRKPRRPDEAEDTARIRRLAISALTASKLADEATITAAAADPDAQVRRLALLAMAAAPPGAVSGEARSKLMAAGFADPDDLVRYEALRIHARSLTGASADWAPVFARAG